MTAAGPMRLLTLAEQFARWRVERGYAVCGCNGLCRGCMEEAHETVEWMKEHFGLGGENGNGNKSGNS